MHGNVLILGSESPFLTFKAGITRTKVVSGSRGKDWKNVKTWESYLWAEVTFKDTGPVFLYNQRSCLLNQNKNALIVPRALWHPGSAWHPCLLLSLMAHCLLSRRGDQECLGHEGLRVLTAGIRCHSSVTLCRGDRCVFVCDFFLSGCLCWVCDFGWLMFCMLLCFRLCWGLLFWGPFVLVWSFGCWRGTLDISGMC